MRGYELRHALAEGKRVYGTCFEGYGQPRWPRYFADLGLDFVFIDSEHTPLNRETMAWAAQAYASLSIAPLLRIPGHSAEAAAMALDLGAHGVIVPYVETLEQVKPLVGAVKYRPLKGAALQTVLDGGPFPSPDSAAYLSSYNENSLLIIMIESPAGAAQLPSILAYGGVDAVLIGPHDLSVSLGLAEQYEHPLFEEAARSIIQTSRAHGVGAGIHFTVGDFERAQRLMAWGCNFIVQRTDTLFVAGGIARELGELRQVLDGVSRSETAEIGAAGHGV